MMTESRQVRFNIMGLRCAEKRHLPQAEQQGVDDRGIRTPSRWAASQPVLQWLGSVNVEAWNSGVGALKPARPRCVTLMSLRKLRMGEAEGLGLTWPDLGAIERV